MDGSAPAAPALPPLSQPAPAIYRPSSPPPPPSQIPNPVGRPSADPEQQAQRIERSAEMKRIESVLPKSIDSKVLVFKSRDGRILPSAKPFMTVLVSELEEAKRNDSDMDSETFVAAKLAERGVQDGKFACRFVDKTGKIIPNTQFEVAIGGDEDDMNDPNGGGFDDDGDGGGMPVFQAPPQAGYQTPPAPPALDADSYMRISRTERNDEAKRGSELASLIAGQQQSTTQLMLQLQQQQRDAQELARRDAADREERAEKRRAEFRQTILTVIPLVLPLIQNFFKRDHGPDATQTMMIELLKSKLSEKPEKGVDAMMLETVMKTMGAMTTQQMAAMQQGTVLTAQMQGEATGLIFKNLMGSMKDLMDSKKDSEPKEESTFQQVLKIAGPILAGMQQQQGPAPGPSADQLAPPVPAAQVVHTEVDQPRRRREKVPPPVAVEPPQDAQQQPTAAPKRHTPLQLINGSLMTIARLSVGEILPIQRFNALNWIRDNAPASLLDAVRAGDENKVLEIGAPAVMSSTALQGWINAPENVEFLRAALADLRHILNGTLTKEIEENSIIAQAEFTTKRKQTVAAERAHHGPPVAQVVNEDGTPMTAHPAATTPVAAQTQPVDEKSSEKPTETTAEAPPAGTTPPPAAAKKPGRRIRKAMPPAAPAADAQPGA